MSTCVIPSVATPLEDDPTSPSIQRLLYVTRVVVELALVSLRPCVCVPES